jgi:hypothetical protein
MIGECVNQDQLLIGGKQRLVVMGTMQIDKSVADLFKDPEGSLGSIDELSVAARNRKDAFKEQLTLFTGVNPLFFLNSNSASTEHCSAPVRISDLSARSPRTSLSPPTMTDLPVPVSPVTTLNPDASSQSSDSTKARFRIRSDRNVAGTDRLCKGATVFFQ